MAYDLLIRNANICDGTGAPVRHGALAVKDGKIAAVGEAGGSARREIDAGGAVLAPGFIDIHTHYDAQISWDPLLTCSSLARRHHAADGQLRRGRRALPPRAAIHDGVGPGQRRGAAA